MRVIARHAKLNGIMGHSCNVANRSIILGVMVTKTILILKMHAKRIVQMKLVSLRI